MVLKVSVCILLVAFPQVGLPTYTNAWTILEILTIFRQPSPLILRFRSITRLRGKPTLSERAFGGLKSSSYLSLRKCCIDSKIRLPHFLGWLGHRFALNANT